MSIEASKRTNGRWSWIGVVAVSVVAAFSASETIAQNLVTIEACPSLGNDSSAVLKARCCKNFSSWGGNCDNWGHWAYVSNGSVAKACDTNSGKFKVKAKIEGRDATDTKWVSASTDKIFVQINSNNKPRVRGNRQHSCN